MYSNILGILTVCFTGMEEQPEYRINGSEPGWVGEKPGIRAAFQLKLQPKYSGDNSLGAICYFYFGKPERAKGLKTRAHVSMHVCSIFRVRLSCSVFHSASFSVTNAVWAPPYLPPPPPSSTSLAPSQG